jgi:hypothetical protein
MAWEIPVDWLKTGAVAKSITVPAGTPEDDPVEAEVELGKGVVVHVEVHFPLGVSATVYTECYYGTYRVFPTHGSEPLTGDGETIPMPVFWPLPEEPARLRIRAWSPEAQHDHTIIWRFAVLPDEVAYASLTIAELTKILKSFILGEEG